MAQVVFGDLSDVDQVRDLAAQVGEAGPFDAVVHDAGRLDGPQTAVVDVVVPAC